MKGATADPATSTRHALVPVMFAFLLFEPALAGAQESGIVRGTIRDRSTGAPVVGASVMARCPGCYGRRSTDSLGRYELTRLPSGTHPLELYCPSRTTLGRELAKLEVAVARGSVTVVNYEVAPGACYEPPYSERKGVFRGHWVSGFESSDFTPCPDSSLGIGNELLPGKRLFGSSAWARLSPGARSQSIDWPDGAPTDRSGNPRYFVAWSGTLKGPGTYGHMGVSEFEMLVDSIVLVKIPGDDDCSGPPRK
jgi:hypothetical protein